MRIAILGPLEVRDDGGRSVEVGGARLRGLLILLALDAGRVTSPERLIADLWEDDPPAGAANALQSLVSRLRALVGRDRVESYPGGYRLVVAPGDVDANDFEARVDEGQRILAAGDPTRAAAVLRDALSLWRGQPLADVAAMPFAEGPVARLEGLRLAAIEDRIESELVLGRYAELVPELQALTAADPLRERPRGQLMRALYGSGQQAEALAAYAETKRALAERLGIDPSPELEAIYLAVLRRDPVLAPETVRPLVPSQASAAEPVRRTNLRVQLTSFVGREEEVERVGKLVDEYRLVTLTGPGGSGKTRLAVEAADRMYEQLADGAWLVELAPVGDPIEVPQAVLATLGVRETAMLSTVRGAPPPSTDPTERLLTALAGKRLLLVLDNCEHLVDAVARLADRLLAGCADVRILTTSREALGITGEALWPVPPLAFPRQDATIEEAASYAAVRLLAERGAAVRPGFTVDTANFDAVLQICRRLDGMPLAIELAAARLRALSAEQIAARLDDRFRLLTGGSRTALPRHQTLRAVVDWSWELLDERERVLLRRMSVFPGGATLEQAERICADSGPTLEQRLDVEDVLDVLTDLTDKSLVVAATSDSAGDTRYRVLETIRAYGAERLAEAGEEVRLRRAHAEHFLALVETAEPLFRTRHQLRWLDRMTAEHDNVHAALRYAIDTGDTDRAVRFTAALAWYWWLRGHRVEATGALTDALALPGASPVQERALSYTFLAIMKFGGQGDMEGAHERLLWARELCRDIDLASAHPMLRMLDPFLYMFDRGNDESAAEEFAALSDDPDPWLRAFAHFMNGHIQENLGRVDLGEQEFATALAGFRALGEHWGLSVSLMALAGRASWCGDHLRAITLLEEAQGHFGPIGAGDEPQIRLLLGREKQLLGEEERAREIFVAALRSAEREGSAEDMASARFYLGELARQEGDFAEARQLLTLAATAFTDGARGSPQVRAMIQVALGYMEAVEGNLDGALRCDQEALRLAAIAHDGPILALTVGGFADVAMRRGDSEQAAVLLGAACAIRGMEDRSLLDVVRTDAAARTALGDEAFAEAYERGRAMSRDEALRFVGFTPDA